MASEEENLNISPEEQEERERAPRGGSAGSPDEARAAEIAERCQSEPMGGWETLAYLHEFYPELDPAVALEVMGIIEKNEQTAEGKTTVDIRSLASELASKLTGEKALESLENCAILDFMLRKAVPEILKARPEDHLKILDVGGGPTIYQHLPLMGIADSIAHSEYLPSNREEIARWQAGSSEFDWQSYITTVQMYLREHPQIFGAASADVRERLREMASKDGRDTENDLRQKINKILAVDVFKEDLELKDEGRQYDLANISREGSVELLTSNFCIESADIKDPEQWRRGIENVAGKVSAGGFLIMSAIRNANWYKVGEKRMNAVPVNAESISAELRKHGFEIKVLSEVVGSEQDIVGYDGMVFVLARKMTPEEIAATPKD